MLEDSRRESSRQVAASKAKHVGKLAKTSWELPDGTVFVRPGSPSKQVEKAAKVYSHALALDPNNKELREKVRAADAARYAESYRCSSDIDLSIILYAASVDLCNVCICTGVATDSVQSLLVGV